MRSRVAWPLRHARQRQACSHSREVAQLNDERSLTLDCFKGAKFHQNSGSLLGQIDEHGVQGPRDDEEDEEAEPVKIWQG